MVYRITLEATFEEGNPCSGLKNVLTPKIPLCFLPKFAVFDIVGNSISQKNKA
jgi:hypothetical protein